MQAPDLAIATYGETIEAAKRAGSEAIQINLEAYHQAGQQVPEGQSVSSHLENRRLALQNHMRHPQFRCMCQRQGD